MSWTWWLRLHCDAVWHFITISFQEQDNTHLSGWTWWKVILQGNIVYGNKMLTCCKTLTQRVNQSCCFALFLFDRITNCINDEKTRGATIQTVGVLVCITSVCVFGICPSVYFSVFSPSVSVPLSLFVYLFFSAVTLSIHQFCRGSFEVTELSILVISGCHHKRLRATSLNSQKGPCIPTKKPLLCNALMLPLLMLLLTMIESRRETEGRKRYREAGGGRWESNGDREGVKYTERERRKEQCVLPVLPTLHRHDFCTSCTFILLSIQSDSIQQHDITD